MSNSIENLDVSILIPTNRSLGGYVNRVINGINCIPKYNMSYEICVFSPGPEVVKGKNVVWYEDKIKDGPLVGFNYLAKRAKGRYFVIGVDDHFFDDNLFAFIKKLDGDKEFQQRKYKIVTINSGGSRNRCYLPTGMPRYTIMRFPIVSRETVFCHFGGFIFHPNFRYHYGDNWTAMFLGANGDPTDETYETGLHRFDVCDDADKYTKYEDKDKAHFYNLIEEFKMGYKSFV